MRRWRRIWVLWEMWCGCGRYGCGGVGMSDEIRLPRYPSRVLLEAYRVRWSWGIIDICQYFWAASLLKGGGGGSPKWIQPACLIGFFFYLVKIWPFHLNLNYVCLQWDFKKCKKIYLDSYVHFYAFSSRWVEKSIACYGQFKILSAMNHIN